MEKRTIRLILITLFIYILLTPMRDFLEILSGIESIDKFSQPTYLMLVPSSFLAFVLFTIIAYQLLFHYYGRLDFRLIFIILLLSWPFIIFFRYLIQEVLFEWLFAIHNYNPDASFSFYFIDNLYYALIFSTIGVAYYFVQLALFTESQRQELELQTKRSELDFLRSQINPHFLFNVLNTIYALINKKSDHALTAVDKLSSMLRYALYEKEKLVPLTKEIDYIRDFILIQNYRQKDGVQLQFDFPETDEAIFIAPFIFITFIENAFKHGVLNDPDFPIRIEFTYTDHKLHFNCRNKIRQQEKDAQGGLGLDNTKRRLELIYGDKQQLKIDQKDSSFNVELTLDLK